MLKQIRQLHLYLGTFFAPAIIFFALTGALQTFGLHETPRGSTTERPAIFVKMAQVHIHQRFAEPPQRPPGPEAAKREADEDEGPAAKKAAQPTAEKAMAPREAGKGDPSAGRSTLPFKIFMLFMAIGLIFTTLLGLYMAFKYNRDRRVTWGLFVAGVVLPLVLLYL